MAPHAVPLNVGRPPAATIGSPGTTIVSVQSFGDSGIRETSDSPSNVHVGRDHVPTQWSFETSYSLLGGITGTPRMHNEEHKKDSKENIQILHGNWFGRKKEKERETEREEKPRDHSRPERSKSVDPPSRTPYPAKSIPPPPQILSQPHSILRPGLPSNPKPKPKSISDASSTPPSNNSQPNLDLNSASLLSSNKNEPHPRTSHVNPPRLVALSHEGALKATRPPSPAARIRTRHPPSSFNLGNGHVGEIEKKRRPTTSPAVRASEHSNLKESFLGDVFSRYGVAEGHTSVMGSYTPYAPTHAATLDVPKPRPRKETPVESLRRRMKEAHTRGFTMKNAKRYHSVPRDKAPYTRDYEHQTIDFDEWAQLFEIHMARKCTFFPFPIPPKRVLDLGCGTGSWVVECAREWKNTTFVGVDLVSIQPDLTRIGETSLASRIQWVVGNFLKRLPFEDGEFDFVHVKRIARGVPENRWESLFDEITRVLKDGGAFEMVEEDLFFPGSVLCESKDDSSDEDSAEQDDIVTESTTGTAGRTDHDMSPSHLSGVEEDGIQSPQARQTDTNTSTETTSLISDIPKARSSMDVLRSRKSIYGGPHSGNPNETEGALFHPLINPISDPRDHSILEMVYNELHASRFINLQPLSLLSSMLVYHFKDVYTHERTEFLFPKVNRRKKSEPSKRPVSLHIPSLPFSPLMDLTTPQASRRKSYHSKMVSPVSSAQALQPPEVLFRPINTITGGVLRLPNDKWRFDERILSMHLAIHVNDILACGEEMWEFIQDCQNDPRQWKNTPMAALSGLLREEWDDCLIRFKLDMQDKMALGDLLRVQFPLGILPLPKRSDRKAFDEAVEKWKRHQRQNVNKATKTSNRPSRRRPISCSLRIFIASKG